MQRAVTKSQELSDLLVGLGIFGTGGGGDPKGWGKSIFDADQDAGRQYMLTDVADVPDDAFILSGGYLGSVADDTVLNRMIDSWQSEFELERAIRIVEEEHGKTADYLIPFELGGGNTPVILSCASRLGISTINGDGVGRAAPETHMCSFMGHGVSLTPMPLVGGDGTEVVVRSGDIFLADEVGRCVASRKGGLLANAHYGMSGEDLKRSAVRGSITRAIDLGRFVRETSATGERGLDAVCEHLGGFPLFHGQVISLVEQEKAGFYVISALLEGLERDKGRQIELIIKNEVMCVKEDGAPLVIFPDLAIILDPISLEGVMTPELSAGRQILVGALPCDEIVRSGLRSPNGKSAFGSERYGEQLDFVPVETLLGAARS